MFVDFLLDLGEAIFHEDLLLAELDPVQAEYWVLPLEFLLGLQELVEVLRGLRCYRAILIAIVAINNMHFVCAGRSRLDFEPSNEHPVIGEVAPDRLGFARQLLGREHPVNPQLRVMR